MSTPIILVKSQLAQSPTKAQAGNAPPDMLWMGAAGALILLSLGFGAFSYFQMSKLAKKLRIEEFKTKDLQKKLKLALETIRKMETNPDLVHSREFNLDYLRMRMAEEVFHFAIVNQIKVQVKEKISIALRPTQAQQATIGIASTTGRQVDETFDVVYQTAEGPKTAKKAVLFRIQIRLMKLPTQATSVTINQIIDCIETFLSPSEEQDNWQPTIQGRIVHMEWDQKAKPTPLLVIEQSNEGVNVSFATKRQGLAPSADMPAPAPAKRPPLSKGEMGQMATAPGSTMPSNGQVTAPMPPPAPRRPMPSNGQMAAAPKARNRPPAVNPVRKTAS